MKDKRRSVKPPLAGVKVLDLTRLLPGPYGTMLLADLGAEVIKIEEPGRGDYVRALNPPVFAAVNRGKKSVTLNLKAEAGREILFSLVRIADVLVESFRPGVMDRLGVGYTVLKEKNPRLIYCAVSGFGQDGPYRDWPGHDINYVGVAGVLGLEETPHPLPIPVADMCAGTFAFATILAALLSRERSGEGQFLDVSATDAALSWMGPRLAIFDLADAKARQIRAGRGAYGAFRCADGKWITVGALEDVFWRNLCQAIGQPELLQDQRYANAPGRSEQREEIAGILGEAIRRKTRAEWLSLFQSADVPAAALNLPSEVWEDPQLQARGLFGAAKDVEGRATRQVNFPVAMAGVERGGEKRLPGLGEHTDEVLVSLGYDEKKIAGWRKQGVI